MVQPPVRIPQEKIVRQQNGGLFVLCSDGQYSGMYPASLADILKCSMRKSSFIIDIFADIAQDLVIDNQDMITDYIFSLSEIIPDPPDVDNKDEYIKNISHFSNAPLLTIADVAEILDITFEFAKEIYESFYQTLDTEEALQEFLRFVDNYIDEYHNGVIPEAYKNKPLVKSYQNAYFDNKRIQEILGQQAPDELRADSILQLIDDVAISNNNPLIEVSENQNTTANTTANTTVTPQVLEGNIIYNAENFVDSPHFESSCQVIQEVLDISFEESAFLVSSADALARFLEIADIETTTLILNQAAIGNIKPLLETVEAKIDDLLQDIQTKNLESLQITPAPQIEEVPLVALPKALPVTQIQDIEPQEPQEIQNSPNNQAVSEENTVGALPDNLPDMLRLAFELKERITAKSLVESFKLFGTEISQSLGRFIIEEGGYGGQPPNSHRIMEQRMVEKLVQDIEKHDNLKAFVKVYLTKVNNDLKSLMAGGG
jgi:hypothetical protein